MSAELKSKQIRQLVGNEIFTITFTKKNGEERVMNCRLGVTKHLKGGELKHNPDDYNHLIVFDMQKKGYRTVSLDTVTIIKFGGKQLTFEQGE